MNRNTSDYRAACRQEFIGREALVTASSHPGYIGVSGTVVDETQRTLRILTGSGVKTIPKSHTTFHMCEHEIDGQHIKFRPENRIKKVR